jgi:hypothetical protein
VRIGRPRFSFTIFHLQTRACLGRFSLIWHVFVNTPCNTFSKPPKIATQLADPVSQNLNISYGKLALCQFFTHPTTDEMVEATGILGCGWRSNTVIKT